MSVLTELQRPGAIADPWPLYARLLDQPGPVWAADIRCWLVARFDQVAQLLVDDRLSAAMDHTRVAAMAPPAMAAWCPLLAAHLSFVPADRHRHLRAVMADPFKPRAVRHLDGWIADLAARLVDDVRPTGQMDVIRDLAWPLPLHVIRDLLGLQANLQNLRAWSTAWGQVIAAPGHLPTGDTTQLVADVDTLISYGHNALAAARPDTLLRRLADTLPPDEALAAVMMLVTAGHETTANLIGNAASDMVTHPQRAALLRERPDLLDAAITEWVRLYPPTQYTARTVLADLEVGGRFIEAGQSVVLMLAAAGRDPDAFAHPDVFRLDRPASPAPLSFGLGRRVCFGAPLARLETRHALAALLTLGELQPAGEPVWRDNHNLRGLATLPITFDGGTR